MQELKRFEAQAGQPRSQWRQEDSLHDLPPIKRPEDKTPNELARELSETRSELERLVVEVSRFVPQFHKPSSTWPNAC